MRSTLLVCFFVSCLFFTATLAEAASVYYMSGRVTAFDGTAIALDGKVYLVKKNAMYVRQFSKNNAFFEEKARSLDVRDADYVVIHVDGTIVDKIIIEEWKR